MGHAGSVKQDVILKLPTSFSELRAVRHTLGLYQRQAPVQVAVLLVATYLFMQVGSASTEPGTFLRRPHCRAAGLTDKQAAVQPGHELC